MLKNNVSSTPETHFTYPIILRSMWTFSNLRSEGIRISLQCCPNCLSPSRLVLNVIVTVCAVATIAIYAGSKAFTVPGVSHGMNKSSCTNILSTYKIQALCLLILFGTQSEIGQIHGKDLIPRKKLISILKSL